MSESEMRGRIERLEQALREYASEDNWARSFVPSHDMEEWVWMRGRPGPDVARAALADIEEADGA